MLDERVTEAFKCMNEAGLLALENFACCMGCALAEAGPRVETEGRRGLVYYHEQDTENAEIHNILQVRYSAPAQEDGSPPPIGQSAEVGREAVRVLVGHGLHVEWSGNADQTIEVHLRV